MIDFRYHLVSLISVFLALAVGIVLGAGPLRENLGDQLAGQVEQLRSEQDTLRTTNGQLTDKNDQLTSFITAAGPELVAGSLEGRRVALLTDHASTRAEMDKVDALLKASGATVTVRVTLQAALWDPSQADRRSRGVDALHAIDSSLTASGVTDGEILARAIDRLALGGDDRLSSEQRSDAWEALMAEQLIALDGDTASRADAVLMGSADPTQLQVTGEDATTASQRAQGLQQAQAAVLTALSRGDVPTVVAGITPGNDSSTSILRTVRGDSSYARLSTTDRLQESDGPLLAVLALAEQVRGGEGDYGTASDADSRLPQLPSGAHGPVPSDGGGAS